MGPSTAEIRLDPAWSDREQLDEFQQRTLRATIDRCTRLHPWYRSRLRAWGITAESIRQFRDLDAVPTITKSDLVADPDSFRLEPDPAEPNDYALCDVMYTAGTTTGSPTPIYQTAYDLRGILFAQLRMAKIRGIQAEDRIANLYPLAPLPHGGWNRPSQAAAALGAYVVSATGGAQVGPYPTTRRFEEIVDLIVRSDPTVLWGVPSYVDRLLRRVAAANKRLPGVRMIAVSGEPCDESRRESLLEMADAVGARGVWISDSLGASELQFSLVECRGGGGFHHPAPEIASIGVVDDDGASVADGVEGRLCFTHLDRRGTVLLRFLVGDRATMDHSPCPHCGWAGGRVTGLFGREGGFVKIRGALVNVAAAHTAVAAERGVLDHRLVLENSNGTDELVVEVAFDENEDATALAQALIGRIRSVIGVRPSVRSVSLDAVWQPDARIKPARFVDRRATPTMEET